MRLADLSCGGITTGKKIWRRLSGSRATLDAAALPNDGPLDGEISVKCVLCGKTSIDAKIEQFPLSPEARQMLKRELGIDPDVALANHGVCRECLALPPTAQRKLADNAIENELDEHRRDLIRDTLNKSRNGN